MTEESCQCVKLLVKYAAWSGSLEAGFHTPVLQESQRPVPFCWAFSRNCPGLFSEHIDTFILATDDTEEGSFGNVMSNGEMKILGQKSLDMWDGMF